MFATPVYEGLARTQIRARLRDGVVEELVEPEYHANPIDPKGSLVTVHWGEAIEELIHAASGLTTIYMTVDRELGIDAAFIAAMISRKPVGEGAFDA